MTNDSACAGWASNGTSTSKGLSGLAEGTTYYWQVRAVNDGGTTYVERLGHRLLELHNGTLHLGRSARPAPANGATGSRTSLTLSWGSIERGDDTTSTATT